MLEYIVGELVHVNTALGFDYEVVLQQRTRRAPGHHPHGIALFLLPFEPSVDVRELVKYQLLDSVRQLTATNRSDT